MYEEQQLIWKTLGFGCIQEGLGVKIQFFNDFLGKKYFKDINNY